MKFMPACLGTWTLNASATYYYLGDSLRDFNTPDTGGDIRDPRNSEWVFSGGLDASLSKRRSPLVQFSLRRSRIRRYDS